MTKRIPARRAVSRTSLGAFVLAAAAIGAIWTCRAQREAGKPPTVAEFSKASNADRYPASPAAGQIPVQPAPWGWVGRWSREFTHGAFEQQDVEPTPSDVAVSDFTNAAYEAADARPGSEAQRTAMQAMGEATSRFGQLNAEQRAEVAAAWQAFADEARTE